MLLDLNHFSCILLIKYISLKSTTVLVVPKCFNAHNCLGTGTKLLKLTHVCLAPFLLASLYFVIHRLNKNGAFCGQMEWLNNGSCIDKHNVGRQVCKHTTTKFYSDSFSTKKHSLDYYHYIIWLHYRLPLLYINAPWVCHWKTYLFKHLGWLGHTIQLQILIQ